MASLGKVWQRGWTFCLAHVFLVAPWAFAAQYYVSPQGKPEGTGARDTPFPAAHVAQNVPLQPGDEVIFLDGVYTQVSLGGSLTIQSVGNGAAPITWRAENRHQAILDGGRPVAPWQRVPGEEGVWETRLDFSPRSLLVDGEGLIDASSRWRRDGKTTLDEGMFAAEPQADKTVLIRLHNWEQRAPREVFAVDGTLVNVAGAFNVFDGFLIRHGHVGVHVAGRQVHVYQPQGHALEVSGLAHNAFGCFNIVRNCIVRDMTSQGMTSNESRFNTIEECVIYNAGMGQGDHGIYVSNGAEDLVLRRNVWWRTSGGAIHIYSGSAIDSPRGIVVQHNIFGPDKRNRCFPLDNRKSTALYVWGGSRYAGHNRITHNVVIGPHDRAISLHRSHFNLVAHNVFLNTSGAPIQVGSGYGNLIVNNIIEYSPGGSGDGFQDRPAGYVACSQGELTDGLNRFRNNLLLPRDEQGREPPAGMEASRVAMADPFVNRAAFDFGLRPDSEAIDLGLTLEHVTGKVVGQAADAGPLEFGAPPDSEAQQLPPIPPWLLQEWPLTNRGK